MSVSKLIIVLCFVFVQIQLLLWYGLIQINHDLIGLHAEKAELIYSRIEKAKNIHSVNVTVTAYSSRIIETDSTPYQTAFMTNVENRTIALPWFLIQRGWTPHNCVYLNIPNVYGGLYRINDRMNDRYKYRADVYFDNTANAIAFGKFHNIDMVYLGKCPWGSDGG